MVGDEVGMFRGGSGRVEEDARVDVGDLRLRLRPRLRQHASPGRIPARDLIGIRTILGESPLQVVALGGCQPDGIGVGRDRVPQLLELADSGLEIERLEFGLPVPTFHGATIPRCETRGNGSRPGRRESCRSRDRWKREFGWRHPWVSSLGTARETPAADSGAMVTSLRPVATTCWFPVRIAWSRKCSPASRIESGVEQGTGASDRVDRPRGRAPGPVVRGEAPDPGGRVARRSSCSARGHPVEVPPRNPAAHRNKVGAPPLRCPEPDRRPHERRAL